MSKQTFIGLASLAASALFTLAPAAPEAMAETPKCKDRANKYVACTDDRQAKAPRRNAKEKEGWIELQSYGHGRKRPQSKTSR